MGRPPGLPMGGIMPPGPTITAPGGIITICPICPIWPIGPMGPLMGRTKNIGWLGGSPMGMPPGPIIPI